MTTEMLGEATSTHTGTLIKARSRAVPHGTDTFLVVTGVSGAAVLGAVANGHWRGSAAICLFGLAAWILVLLTVCTVLRGNRQARLNAAIGGLHAVAAGDLRPTRLESVGLGEASTIEAATEKIATRLRAEITRLESAAEQLNSGWTEVYQLGYSMLTMSEGTVHDAAVAARSAELVSSKMQHIASANVEMAATVREIAGHAAQASSVATAGAEQVLKASGTMTDLELATNEVQDVVKVIASIASQTRVLALNATIEAGRAGEAGRGFTVVADNVKSLARKTADATEQITETVRGIKTGSVSAVDVMQRITQMIQQVSANQTAIASAVEEQTAASAEVGQSSASVADNATELARTVQALTHTIRLTAYFGAQAKTVAAHLTELEDSIGAITGEYTFERPPAETAPTIDDARERGTRTVGQTTTVQDYVLGSGINKFCYSGRWNQGAGNVEAAGNASYCSIPDDTMTFRFVGTRVRLHGTLDVNHGMGEVSIDGVPACVIDEYAPRRVPGTMLFESPILPRGEHQLSLRVLGEANPQSKYYWVTVDYVAVDA